jgi:NADPH:quinone reductase-like Zn-dependent oxidoreductase
MTTLQRTTKDAMRAFVLRSYGGSEQLELGTVDRPVPGEGEVLVRVRATSVQPYDWHIMRGEPYAARLFPGALGLRRPKIRILGADLAGEVAAVGAGVSRFHPGDDVFALLAGGGFGEYTSVPATELARMPANLSYEQAAAVPMAGITALLAVRDCGRVGPGQRVLVNGASGGVGTFAVQLAKAAGGEVTGVCSGRNRDLVTSIGADRVIDHTGTDFTRTGQRYHVLVDIAGSRSGLACRRAVERNGTTVLVGGRPGRWLQPVGHMIGMAAVAVFSPHRVAQAQATGRTDNQQNLRTLTGLIESGKVTPVIDRRYPFEKLPSAVRYVEEGHAPGKVVIAV